MIIGSFFWIKSIAHLFTNMHIITKTTDDLSLLNENDHQKIVEKI